MTVLGPKTIVHEIKYELIKDHGVAVGAQVSFEKMEELLKKPGWKFMLHTRASTSSTKWGVILPVLKRGRSSTSGLLQKQVFCSCTCGQVSKQGRDECRRS